MQQFYNVKKTTDTGIAVPTASGNFLWKNVLKHQ
jgi:hypothetical protein